ncbi:Cu2+-exporting ATPase [Persephonella hydrogeniphila]|uniref:Cu2+-exporting ATPase n=1 Tax=Persephonella hydrogeniphila TaxID=198703 RepID=A0A285NM68_9AQUI|nr:heavy metal-associated domain-containing protein [Persephonella hydrogeniphila]SNZ10555.1 Cu2+-exporting ATPase [Persephonella hydrogeniphila]
MDKIAVLSLSMAMIGGISWFFFGNKDDGKKPENSSEKIKKVELNISGMHCAGCVAGIEATLKATEGVITASVNLATSKGVFEYDPSKISKEQIIQKIKDLGYDASEDLQNFEKKS